MKPNGIERKCTNCRYYTEMGFRDYYKYNASIDVIDGVPTYEPCVYKVRDCNNWERGGLIGWIKPQEYLAKKRHTELVLSIANVEDSEIWNRHNGKWEILGEIINELFGEIE